jgi:hypothetical protein
MSAFRASRNGAGWYGSGVMVPTVTAPPERQVIRG